MMKIRRTSRTIEFWDDDEEWEGEPVAEFSCFGCRRIAQFASKTALAEWLWNLVTRRWPAITLAQVKSLLTNWLNNNPDIRDALPDGAGW